MSSRTIPISSMPTRPTPQEIMQMESLKDFTEEQAKELLNIVEAFCEIAYNIWKRQEIKHLNSGQVIELTTKKRAA